MSTSKPVGILAAAIASAVFAAPAPAQVAVDARGGLATTVAIEVPAFHGITPDVRLTYRSAGGPGLAGAGWSLTADSQITRTSATGGIAGPTLDLTDRFWLDGAELVQCTATSASPSCSTARAWVGVGQSLAFYSTKVESFRRIRREYLGWKIWERDGTIVDYVSTDNGGSYQRALVTDTSGNRVEYAWSCDQGCELDAIRYGDTSDGADVRFYREDRPDPWRDRNGAGPVLHRQRLRSIVVRNHGQLVRAYRFGYGDSLESRASILTSVQQFGVDATIDSDGLVTAGATLPAQTFASASLTAAGGWSLAAETSSPWLLDVSAPLAVPLAPRYAGPFADVAADVESVPNGGDGDTYSTDHGYLTGDFDGDGRAELATWGLQLLCTEIALRAHPTDGTATLPPPVSSPVWSIGTTARCPSGVLASPPAVFVADVNGDGADDILFAAGTELRRFVARGDGSFLSGQVSTWDPQTGGCTVADVDGDGRDDLICEQSASHQLVTRRATPTGWIPTAIATNAGGPWLPDHTNLTLASGDVDGDGLADLIVARPNVAAATTRVVLGRSIGDGTYDWGEQQTFAFTGTLDTADVDGDGKLDLVWSRGVTTSELDVALARKGEGLERWRLIPRQTTALTTLRFADVDGDGRADLIGRVLATPGADLSFQRATGDGGFGGLEANQATCDLGAGSVDIVPADWNGDGLADPTCIAGIGEDGAADLHYVYRVIERPAQPRGADRRRWMRADVDGDGRLELVYVAFRNPGYTVHVVSPQTGQRISVPVNAIAGQRLREPDAGRWVVADVGSPAGPADGKDDLVLVEHVAGRLITTTLLSTGLGTFSLVQHDVDAAPSVSTAGWFPASDDRDGRSALLRTRAVASTTSGIRVELLRPIGPGQFAFTSRPYFEGGSPAPMTDRSARGFKPADLDGDGLTDLVHVDAAPGAGVVVRSLRANGAGGFVEAAATLATTITGPRSVRVGDLDGDGAADVYSVARSNVLASCLRITHFAGNGRGGFALGSVGGTGCVDSTDPLFRKVFEDAAGVVALDLDQDGRAELVHISHVTDAAGVQHLLVARLRRDLAGPVPTWRVTTFQPSLAFDLGDAWSWSPYRDPMTGDAGLSYVHPQVSVLLRWPRVRDELTEVRNGLGLVSSIGYGPFSGTRAYLPAGYVPRVVTKVRTRDLAESPPTVDDVQYGYLGATWSDERGLLGFTTTSANDGRQIRYARYALGDACGAQLVGDDLRDPAGAAWGYSTTQYRAPGAVPYQCEVTGSTAWECERAATCRVAAVRTVVDRDAYGNVKQELVTADQAAPLLTATAPAAVDPMSYVIDRPAATLTYGFEDGAWRQKTARTFGYDDLAVGAAPIRGLVTAFGVRDDQTNATLITTYGYDSHGYQIRETSPEQRTITTVIDPVFHQHPLSVCDALNCQHLTWNDVLDKPDTATDAAGADTRFNYDEHGRLVRTDFVDGAFLSTHYLAAGVVTGAPADRQRVRTERSDGSADDVLWSEAFYDGTGRTYRTTREGGATVTTRFADGSARPAAISELHDAAAAPSRWTSFQYDGVGRPLTTTLPDSNTRTVAYAVGTRTFSDELGARRTERTDGLGRVVEHLDGYGARTTYQHDALGRLTVVTNALGHRDQIAWSSRGLQTSTTDPDRGTRAYEYTLDGALQTLTDAKGQRRHWSYDVLGRVELRTDDDAAGQEVRKVAMTYDDGGAPHGSSTGRLIRIDDTQSMASLSAEHWYDGRGRIERTRRCVDDVCMTEGVAYDLAGRVRTLHYPDGRGDLDTSGAEDVVQSYDDVGRLADVGNYATLRYQPDDLLRMIRFGNQVKTVYTYTPERGWLESLTTSTPSGDSATIRYEHDAVGRVLSQRASGALYAKLDYRYDDLGRLIGVDASDPSRTERFAYDAIGRMRWQPDLGDFHYDDPRHVHAMTTTDYGSRRRYDRNGNVISLIDASGRALRLGWTVDDTLAQVDDLRAGIVHGFVYDVDGQRVKKVDDTGVTRYFGPHLEVDAGGAFVKSYLAGDLLVARDRGGDRTYFHHDVGHDVRLVTDDSGGIVETREYRAFGAPQRTTGSGANDIGFDGARTESDLGLIVLGARTYDPIVGQFLSADSIIPSLGRPQSLNRYSYVENDPVNYRDPSGHMRLLIELRKARIAETPGILSYEEANAFIGKFGAWFDRGETLDQALERQLGYYQQAYGEATKDHGSATTSAAKDHEPVNATTSAAKAHEGVAPPGTDPTSVRRAGGAGGVPGFFVSGIVGQCSTDTSLGMYISDLQNSAVHLLDDVLAIPHDGFFFIGMESDYKLKRWALDWSRSAEGMQLFGHSSDHGFYSESLVALGYSANASLRGTHAYGGVFAATGSLEWSSKDGFSNGETSPGILVEGGFGPERATGYAGAYSFGDTQGSYLGVKSGPYFVGVGGSWETALFVPRAQMVVLGWALSEGSRAYQLYQAWQGSR